MKAEKKKRNHSSSDGFGTVATDDDGEVEEEAQENCNMPQC